MPKYTQKKATPATEERSSARSSLDVGHGMDSHSRLRRLEGRAFVRRKAYELTKRLKRPKSMTM